MNRQACVKKALSHEDPGRVPVDFGSTAVSGMHVSCVAALRKHYGLAEGPVKVHEPYQMLGLIEDDLLDALDVDVAGLPDRSTIFGFANENWREFRLPWGQEVLVSEHFRTTTAPNGDLLIHPQGDVNAPPSGRMAAGSFFFDSIIRQPPIDEDRLDPKDNLEEFGPVSDADLKALARDADRLAATGRAVIAGLPGTAFGDIALVPAPFLKHPKGIRNVAEWYISTVARRDYLHAVFSRQCELALENLPKYLGALGDRVDAVFICGTDFGTQTSSFCSPATFDELYAPYYTQINRWIHTHTTWKTFKHSCGAIEPFMDRFIEAGFDIINPVQCSAAGMQPERLKDRYGDRLVFWGGGVDTQKTLPFGTPAQVRTEVCLCCDLHGLQT